MNDTITFIIFFITIREQINITSVFLEVVGGSVQTFDFNAGKFYFLLMRWGSGGELREILIFAYLIKFMLQKLCFMWNFWLPRWGRWFRKLLKMITNLTLPKRWWVVENVEISCWRNIDLFPYIFHLTQTSLWTQSN